VLFLTQTVIKIHSDFYYVLSGDRVFECKLREKLKKEKREVFVGDFVKLEEINQKSGQAVISEILDRITFIPRPAVANIDQVVIVFSIQKPLFEFTQLDRYLVQAKLYNIPVVICINKSDLEDEDKLSEKIIQVYNPLGYKIIFSSAKTGKGTQELKKVLASKKSVLCGLSGVGKSSILNKIYSELNLRTKEISSKTQRGTHTTRHSELIKIPVDTDKYAWVTDTPGFSLLKFDNILPVEVGSYFEDIAKYSRDCAFSDCLHLKEKGCKVLENIDKIEPSRYESYKVFVDEAFKYKEKIALRGHKKEEKFKELDSKDNKKTRIIKIKAEAKEESRSTRKQKLTPVLISMGTYYNEEHETD